MEYTFKIVVDAPDNDPSIVPSVLDEDMDYLRIKLQYWIREELRDSGLTFEITADEPEATFATD